MSSDHQQVGLAIAVTRADQTIIHQLPSPYGSLRKQRILSSAEHSLRVAWRVSLSTCLAGTRETKEEDCWLAFTSLEVGMRQKSSVPQPHWSASVLLTPDTTVMSAFTLVVRFPLGSALPRGFPSRLQNVAPRRS